MEQTITNNEKLSEILPMLRQQFDFINSDSVKEYADKLDKVTGEALGELEKILTDGTLALDPEQLVAAVQVLTRAKKDISESKRKLIETLLRGEVMMKALEPKKNAGGENSALLEYLKAKGVAEGVGSGNSIFEQVNALEEN